MTSRHSPSYKCAVRSAHPVLKPFVARRLAVLLSVFLFTDYWFLRRTRRTHSHTHDQDHGHKNNEREHLPVLFDPDGSLVVVRVAASSATVPTSIAAVVVVTAILLLLHTLHGTTESTVVVFIGIRFHVDIFLVLELLNRDFRRRVHRVMLRLCSRERG